MNRNKPFEFENDDQFRGKWLSNWNKDELGDYGDGYVEKVKCLSSDERFDLLIRLISYIDLTTLSGDDTKQKVENLVDKATSIGPFRKTSKGDAGPAELRCAAVCVYPARVADVVGRLASTNKETIAIASVAGGFPSGQYRLESRLLEIQLAISDGANEIDTVINRAAALTDQWKLVHEELVQMRALCGDRALLKTILATGELGSPERIFTASMVAMTAGSDFIKTSTGKETVNATLPVSYVMCKAIGHYYKSTGIKVGFKAAGGIRTTDQALSYVLLVRDVLGDDWLTPRLFRIGASSLLDSIIEELLK